MMAGGVGRRCGWRSQGRFERQVSADAGGLREELEAVDQWG